MSFAFYSPPFQVYADQSPVSTSDSDSEGDPSSCWGGALPQESHHNWHYGSWFCPTVATQHSVATNMYPWEPVIKQNNTNSNPAYGEDNSVLLNAEQVDLLRAYVNTPQQQQEDARGTCLPLQACFNPYYHVVSPTQTCVSPPLFSSSSSSSSPSSPQLVSASSSAASPASTSLSSVGAEDASSSRSSSQNKKTSGRSSSSSSSTFPSQRRRSTRHKTAGRQSITAAGSSEDNVHRPFKCPECDMVFKRQEHVKRHYRSIHTHDKRKFNVSTHH